MSDIPIGSPQAPPGRHAAPSGWYADPLDAATERWWDGWQWSRNTRPRERSGSAPARLGGWPHARSSHAPVGHAGRPVAPTVPAGAPVTADGVPLAGWGLRALAALLDSLLVGTVAGAASLPILLPALQRVLALVTTASPSGSSPSFELMLAAGELSPVRNLLLVVVQLAVGLAYHVLFLRRMAATPGKLVTGLRVTPVDQGHSQERLGWGSVVVRALVWLAPLASGWLLSVRVLDALLPLWHPKRQSLHDLAAKTQVIRTR